MAKQGYTSNARIFERRGNPWLSRREQLKDYERNPETEDPEYDFDNRFHYTQNARGKPKIAPPRVEEKTEVPPPQEDDFARRRASILHKLHRENQRVTVEVKDEIVKRFQPCAGCRLAICAARNRCGYPAGRPKR